MNKQSSIYRTCTYYITLIVKKVKIESNYFLDYKIYWSALVQIFGIKYHNENIHIEFINVFVI